MSSLLRGTRLLLRHSVRRISFLPSAGVRYEPQAASQVWTSSFITRTLSTEPGVLMQATEEAGSSRAALPPAPVGQLSDIERQLELLDSNVRWRGRIEKDEVENVLQLYHKEGQMSDQQALMLLRCSGSLMVKESPATRMKMFHQIWETLLNSGFKVKTSHYNAALRVQMDNKHNFVPTDMLATMEALADTKPNRVTYQLILAYYCEEGDIEGATKILQFMKSQNLPINETVFNSLIKGHIKRGDVEGAQAVLDSMRTAGLEPSSETYKGMLCAHAEKGDLTAMQQVMENAQKDECQLHSRQILEAIIILADNDHHGLIEQVLTEVRTDLSHSVLNCAHQLIARGHDETAVRVYLHLLQPPDADETSYAGAKALIRTMVMCDRPIEKITAAVETLKSNGRLDGMGAKHLASFGLILDKPDVAFVGIKLMKEAGEPIRPHFFWPVLYNYNSAKNTEGVYNVASLMLSSAERNADYIPTLYRRLFRQLQTTHGQDQTTIITKLQELGYKTEDLNTVQLLNLLGKGSLEEAVEFMENSPFTANSESFKNAMMGAGMQSNDVNLTCRVLKRLQPAFGTASGVITSEIINSILGNCDDETKLQLGKACVDQELLMSPIGTERVSKALEKAGAEESLLMRISTLIMPVRRRQAMERAEAESMSAEALEQELQSRLPQDRDVNIIRKQLLMKYCGKGDVEKADALRASMEAEGFVFDSMLLKNLMYMSSHFKQDLDESLKYKELLERNHPEFSNYTKAVLNIAHLQAKGKDFEGALKTVVQYAESKGKNKFADSFEMVNEINRLVQVFRKLATPAQTRELVQAMFTHGFVKNGTFNFLQSVVASYLEKEDLDGLVDVLEHYHDQYNRVPMFSQVFRLLIQKEDAERLQKVVDLVTSLNGEMPVLQQLVIAFIDCNQVKKARKILETPGMRANMPVLKAGIDNYVQNGKEEELRHLIEVTRDLFAVDQDEMLFGLIRLEASKKDTDAEKCMDVLTMYEEYNTKPRPRTLRYLAKVLQSAGHEVTFEVPAIVSRETPTLKGKSKLESDALRAVKDGEIQTLFNVLNKRSDSSSMSAEFVSGLAEQVSKNLGRTAFRQLAYFLGQENDLESLAAILDKKDLPPPLARFTKQQLFKGQIRRGEAEATIEEMESQPITVMDYLSTAGLQDLAQSSPQLLPRVETVVERQLADNPEVVMPANILFEHYVKTGKREEAEQLWKSNEHFRMQSKLMVSATHLREENNEEGLQWLLSLTKDVSPGKQSLIFSQLIALKNASDDMDGALAVCQDARDAGLEYVQLWKTAMKQLEVQLLAKDRQPPWQVGIFDQKVQTARSSSPPPTGLDPASNQSNS